VKRRRSGRKKDARKGGEKRREVKAYIKVPNVITVKNALVTISDFSFHIIETTNQAKLPNPNMIGPNG